MAKKRGLMERFARQATNWTGKSAAFALAFLAIVVWAVTGPIFNYSDTWQLVINTATTIVTFLMVFLIQRAQNKDSQALHLKLNEIVAALQGASNRLINVENLSEDEVEFLRKHYAELVRLAREDDCLTEAHSIEDAMERHRLKRRERRHEAAAGTNGAAKAVPHPPAPSPKEGEGEEDRRGASGASNGTAGALGV